MNVYKAIRTRLVTEQFSVLADSEEEAFQLVDEGESEDCEKVMETTHHSESEIEILDEV